MKCINCGKDNKNTNIRCEFCDVDLERVEVNKEEDVTLSQKIITIVSLVVVSIVIVYGLILVGNAIYLGGSWAITKNRYEYTTGLLEEVTDCRLDEDNESICSAIYSYKVGENEYKVLFDGGYSLDDYNNVGSIYYDENNPEESVVYDKENLLLTFVFTLIYGIMFIGVGGFILLFIISIYKTIKGGKKVVK